MTGDPDPAVPRLTALTEITGERVTLRDWTLDDLPALAEASRDPYIPLITTVPADYTEQAGRDWLARQHEHALYGAGRAWAVTSRETTHVLGFAVVHSISWHHRRAQLGYWILARHRGHGYARETVGLLAGLARDWGLTRLEAIIETGNDASIRVCESAGFTYEGTLRSYFRLGGRPRDMMMYALIN